MGCPLDLYQIPMQYSSLGGPCQMYLSRSGLSGVSAETKGQMGKGERIYRNVHYVTQGTC